MHKEIIEVEQKFRLDSDQKAFEQELATRNFCRQDQIRETDTYFTDLQGTYIADRTCLRIREHTDKGGTTFERTYKGPSADTRSTYAKTEKNTPLAPTELDAELADIRAAGHRIYCVVRKHRVCFTRKEADRTLNILIDTLRGHGTFIEFELLAKNGNYDDLQECLNELIAEFSAHQLTPVTKPYRDIVATNIHDNWFTSAPGPYAKHVREQASPQALKVFDEHKEHIDISTVHKDVLDKAESADQILMIALYAH